MRGSNLIKLLKTLDRLGRPEGTTIEELQNELGIDRRSVYRQMQLVHDLGFPLYDDKVPFEKRKRWKLTEGYLKRLPNMKVPNVELSLSEIVALHLLKGEGTIYRGTEIENAIDSAFTKIGLFASNGLEDKLKKVSALFTPSSKFAKDYSGKEKTIDALTDSILRNNSCRITYHSFYDDKVKEFEIDPLNFFEHNGGLYIFARKTGTKDIRVLAVERIKRLEVMDLIFKYPKGFDPEELLSNAFCITYDDPVKAKVRFSADQAKYVKQRKWAKDQRIIDQPDGSIILEIKTSGWWDVKKWVLSFGAEAEVLEPEGLREEIRKEFETAMGKYTMKNIKHKERIGK